MPRKVLPDENANAKRKSNVASKRNGMARKKVLLGGRHDPTQGRIFAREIKNIAGSTSCQNAEATVNELECGISGAGELSLLDRFTTDFGVLTLRGVDATQEIMRQPGYGLFATRGSTSSQFSGRTRWPVSSTRLCNTRAACENRPAGSSGYDSDTGSQISSTCLCRRHQFSGNAFHRTRKSSFRSASIASQSTPLPARVAVRSVRPLSVLDDDSSLRFRYFTNPEPVIGRRHGSGNEALNEALDKNTGQTTGSDVAGDNELMTQLASQLSQLVISPCTAPRADEHLDLPDVELGSTSLLLHSHPRTASFSLGFIPVAFPDEIDVNDLRIIL